MTINQEHKIGKEPRMSVVDTLKDMMASDDKVVALEADLGGASGFTKIEKAYPNQFIQCGIAEANMVGVATGLSMLGYKPYIHTFAPFATRRVFDQLYLSGGYANTDINIYGSDPGFTVGPNGGTHTSWEDIALMRTIPGAIVCDAADDVQMQWILREFSKRKGVKYVRGNRKGVHDIYTLDTSFSIGKGNILTNGKDVLLITAGQLCYEALECSERLRKQGISVEVVDMFCIKPLDIELILKEIKGKKLVITFENHSIIGGLGSAVSEVLAEHASAIPFKRIGVNDRFGQVGTPAYLQKEFGLTTDDLENKIIELYKEDY